MKLIDLTGKKVNRLTVLRKVESDKYGHPRWLCRCDCGNETVVWGSELRRGRIQSCGCWKKERMGELNKKHGHKNDRLYNTWAGMIQRCENPKAHNYKDYGGRGISVCEEWHDFMCFFRWSMENGYNDDLTIDRINNDAGYEPDNCRWTTYKTQANNKRNNHFLTYNGETHTISEWSKITGIDKGTIRNRIVLHGWSVEKALTTKTT
jgi:hypothetical protein